MVALNENFAAKNPHSVEENRVGNFFGQDRKSRQANRLSAQQPRRENGHDYDETASGMFFYGFRYYDPVTGRWPSRDPLGEAGGLNIYRLTKNDALNWFDYLGLARGRPNSSGDRPGEGLGDWGGPATGGGWRSPLDGPKYGNWGGKDWSGGKDGSKPPIDSSDMCYEDHDLCYGSCPPVTCRSRSNQGKQQREEKRKCIKKCDEELKTCLKNLPDDPKNWPFPPPPGMEQNANDFRDAALDFF